MRVFDEVSQIKHSSLFMKSSKICVVALACVAVAVNARQEPQPPVKVPLVKGARQTRVLTLEECIRMALLHNLDIQITQYTPLFDQYTISVAYAAYEPTASFRATHRMNSSPGGIDTTTGLALPSRVTHSDIFTPDISGSLPTGTTYDLTGGSLIDQSGTGIRPDLQWSANPGPGITLTQPLLKGFWIDQTRFTIQLDKNALKFDEQALRQQIMKTVTDVQTAYYELIFARENVRVNQEALKLAQQLVSENLKRVEVGALAPLDEKQSESQAASSEADLLTALQTQGTDENNLKSLITDNYGEWVNVTPVPAESLTATPQQFDLQESWRSALENRPDILQQRLTLDKNNITVKYDFNQLFPTLNLQGSYGRNALAGSFTGILGDVREEKNPFYTYGVVVSMPLGNGAARNNYRIAKATVQQQLLALKRTEQLAIVTVENDVGQLRADLQTIKARHAATVYAKDALEAEQKKLENGKSTSFQVLQLQKDYTNAQTLEIRAIASYNQHIAQLALDEGTTLTKNRIDLTKK
ncbi:TolC family protein [Pedosphaera parvula]|uniref:Outer membrane efflux protein n=1 Tax=Pedosphaera parvula (strain Ellin514) TaxID=320771 RepID=B9XJM0_PEDPL|nr:TolC family protein [Pedosphaera parvula]EEF59896.1 outer membrane efflux protein [Pedosphaera parvula Ellin514]